MVNLLLFMSVQVIISNRGPSNQSTCLGEQSCLRKTTKELPSCGDTKLIALGLSQLSYANLCFGIAVILLWEDICLVIFSSLRFANNEAVFICKKKTLHLLDLYFTDCRYITPRKIKKKKKIVSLLNQVLEK